jgi:ABC-type phosphate/phosphonate transport system substrate-binding protein
VSPSRLTRVRDLLIAHRSVRWLTFALINTVVVLVGGSLLMLSLFRASEEIHETSLPIAPFDALTVVMANLPGGVQDWESHEGAIAAIEESTGRPVALRYLTYGDSAVDAVLTSDVDIAFLSLRGFLLFMDSGNSDYFTMCRPLVGTEDYDCGVVVVNALSDYHTLDDLRGATIALGPTERPGGYGFAHWLMAERQTSVEEYFGEIEVGSRPSEDLRALKYDEVDAVATTRSQLEVWPRNRFRVIVESPEYSTPSILVNKSVPPRVREQIRVALEALEPGEGLPEESNIDGFVSGTRTDYSFAKVLLPYSCPSEGGPSRASETQ